MSIIKSMFNKSMSKLETPEVLAEQAEMELESDFKKITESLTQSIMTEKMLDKQIEQSTKELSTWEKRALVAVQQNNDDLARQCLSKKQELAQTLQSQEAQRSEQQKTTAMLKERHKELKAKLDDFKMKKTQMTARLQSSEAMARAQELVGGTGNSGSSMEKWEQKIAMSEAKAQAVREMNEVNAISDQFKELDKQAMVNDELALLKSSINTGPKLIVAKEPQKEQVDDNLPMVIEDAEIIDPDNEKK